MTTATSFALAPLSLSARAYRGGGKRLWDLLGAALSLTLAALPLGLCLLLIWRESPGAPLIRQWRVGRGGRPFRMWKLRTMRADAEADGHPRFASPHDERVTPMGGWLRSWHGDELPQLWNVLRGDMSLVGPRPERPEFAALFAAAIPGYRERHRLRPGLTGWAQVACGYAADLDSTRAKTRLDLEYLAAASWRLDWRIWCATWRVSRRSLQLRARTQVMP
ncbi:MAG: sugar transferase [Terriglobales bacterium]